MLARLTAIDPKLLAFSLLLAGVSLYLLIKAKTSAKNPHTPAHQTGRSTPRAEDRTLERRDRLIKRALEVEKACKVLDGKFLEELEEMKVLAKRYEEDVLAVGEEEWVVREKVGKRKKRKRSKTSLASSVSDSTEIPEGNTIYSGLRYTSTETTDHDPEIELTFTHCPAVDPKEKDKDRRRKSMAKALAAVRKAVEEYPEATVNLLIGPQERIAESETTRVADLVKGTDYAAAPFRGMMPRKIPTSIADMLGHNASASQTTDDIFFLGKLLNTLRPRKLTLHLPPLQDEPERFLIPAAQMALVIAGARVFRSRKHALETIEVGPLVPVSRDCESAYHFIFAEWRVKMLMIDCASGGTASDKSSLEGRGLSVASILFDPEYGFVRMMAGMQSDEAGEKESGTKIVLVVETKTFIDDFRTQVESMANQRESKSKARLDYASNPEYRLELFRQKMFYLSKGKSRPRQIWTESP